MHYVRQGTSLSIPSSVTGGTARRARADPSPNDAHDHVTGVNAVPKWCSTATATLGTQLHTTTALFCHGAGGTERRARTFAETSSSSSNCSPSAIKQKGDIEPIIINDQDDHASFSSPDQFLRFRGRHLGKDAASNTAVDDSVQPVVKRTANSEQTGRGCHTASEACFQSEHPKHPPQAQPLRVAER